MIELTQQYTLRTLDEKDSDFFLNKRNAVGFRSCIFKSSWESHHLINDYLIAYNVKKNNSSYNFTTQMINLYIKCTNFTSMHEHMHCNDFLQKYY